MLFVGLTPQFKLCLFKNVYINWQAKPCFECPLIDNYTVSEESTEETFFPSFTLIQKFYEIGNGRSEKIGYKLNEKVLYPQVKEKTNLKLADSVIH